MKRYPTLVVPLLCLSGLAHAQSSQNFAPPVPVEQLEVTILDLQVPQETTGGATQQPLVTHETNSELRIELPGDILFDFDKAEIRPSAEEALRKAGDLIGMRATQQVRVEGYTDSKGEAGYNQRLSLRRAEAVGRWLRQKDGLDAVHFTEFGWGAAKPVAPNTHPDGSDNPEGRQRNRRVELILQKN